jgi:hypothetical protein
MGAATAAGWGWHHPRNGLGRLPHDQPWVLAWGLMSPKPPSKQKRAAQNRARRSAHAARIANAQARAESSARSSGSTGGRTSVLGRLFGGGGSGSAGRVASARSQGAALRGEQPPGYRAAMSAVLAAVAAAVVCAVALRYPVDADGDLYTRETLVADWSITAADAAAAEPDADAAAVADTIDEWAPGREQETVAKALWPYSLAIVLPIIGSGLGFQAVRRRSPSKVVNRALYATLFGAVLTQGLLLLFLPTVIAMGVAMYQVRKAEAMAASEAGSDTVVPDAGTVIDVEEADDELVEDEELAAELDDHDEPARDGSDPAR